jgi:2-keto-4-pentenoate hydratase/2-oxohepta-3-ene-1,7-dioic acid hydratase in catechol pathway
LYESPFCSFTNPHALTGPGDDIAAPSGCRRLDLELEVAAVIGQPGRDLRPEDAGAQLVAYASQGTWVRTGDVLGSGTCGYGCLLELWGREGSGAHEPLGPGDRGALHVEGIGTLRNEIVGGAEPHSLPRAASRRMASQR